MNKYHYLHKHTKPAIYLLTIALLSACGGSSENNNPTATAALQKYYIDADGDTFGNAKVSQIATTTTQPTGYVLNNTDCDDTDATIHPTALEVFDSVDNNCNGVIDENFVTYYLDADGDSYGDPNVSIVATIQPVGYVTNNGDCNDADNTVHPGAIEIPADGKDNNCNGQIDETQYYYRDADADTFGDPNLSQIGATPPVGYVSNNTDCDDANANINPAAPEIIGNFIDDNCDGLVL